MAGFVLILIFLVVWMIKNLERSNTGREMLAVRNAPAAAASIGVSPTATKLKVFALSAGVAGLGGVLLATNDIAITSNSVPPITGLFWLAGVVLLGIRRPAGAIVAGLFITLMPALLSGFTLPFDLAHWSGTRAGEVPTILFGLGAIALARQPDGVFQNVARQNFERRERRRQRRLAGASGPAPSVEGSSTGGAVLAPAATSGPDAR
jgi:ABC-type branched-subunit amino acid transport system permease subunit